MNLKQHATIAISLGVSFCIGAILFSGLVLFAPMPKPIQESHHVEAILPKPVTTIPYMRETAPRDALIPVMVDAAPVAVAEVEPEPHAVEDLKRAAANKPKIDRRPARKAIAKPKPKSKAAKSKNQR